MSRQDLPESWVKTSFGEVFKVRGGSQPPKSTFIYEPADGYIRLLQIRDFGEKPVPTYVRKDRVTKFCTEEDILIARYGASLGRILTGMAGAYNVALAKVLFNRECIDPKYVFNYLNTTFFQTPLAMMSRSAQNGFSEGELREFVFPLPPLAEQKRIVAKIEELFSELDAGEESLRRARRQLGVYRQSLLKQAFEGKLTARWREQNADQIESPDQLLARIQTEREARYEQQIKEWEKEVKEWEKAYTDEKRPPKPQQLTPSDDSIPVFDMDFPAGWCVLNLSQFVL
jgi:type I restriction enzyme S subunit